MNVLKKYAQSAGVVGVILTALFWFHNRIEKRFDKIDIRFEKIDDRLTQVEKDLAIVKTVLIIKDIMPKELALEKENK